MQMPRFRCRERECGFKFEERNGGLEKNNSIKGFFRARRDSVERAFGRRRNKGVNTTNGSLGR